jgi:DNA-3-methyladenine glycosylase I
LNWSTILARRENYRQAFDNFQPELVAAYGEEKINTLLQDPSLIRNRLKIRSAVQNARAFLQVQAEFGSFSQYIWGFVGGKPRRSSFETPSQMQTQSIESVAMSKDLKKRGFTFVGPTICYAYMQAVGMVTDHAVSCHRSQDTDGA